MQKVCGACRKPFEARNGRAKFCSSACRGRAHRGSVVPLPVPAPEPTRSVVAAATRVLEAADRLDTPSGTAALVLAGRLDAGTDTGSALASMTKELRAALADATAGVAAQPDEIDELGAHRRRRLGSG